ncbi:glycoside hydrolase family 52 protein [Paenibacillus sp. alder61]|uniref:glycoside hydrolase family 52 protein n=1 Tax=Paenibacillus sp. alder61 TaxID=2862948 RepID=UPI001CD7E473|nr:glycoside hydrolase family 52 protein [Paenibacillus sp. alder61]MCA1293738.1 glycoside hydrolase family 52 protein [Paenibacillus sp. alder61]
MGKNIFFNAHHSPVGAFASFTLGYPGKSGGFDLELGSPPNQNIYIGLQEDGEEKYRALPFFGEGQDERDRYTSEQNGSGKAADEALLLPFSREAVSRKFGAAIDEWQAGDLTFRLYSPFGSVPDPASADAEELKFALVPAVLAEIIVDNTRGTSARKAFFGFHGTDPYSAIRRLEDTTEGEITGIGQGRHLAIATDDRRVKSAGFFTIEDVLKPKVEENLRFGLGPVGALLMDTPAGEKATYRFALCFYKSGFVTTGMDAAYFYTRYFADIEDVARYALKHYDRKVEAAGWCEGFAKASHLNEDQRFMLHHAIRSYYGSTELLEHRGEPLWIVNEGEYRMINTFDLTVDQLFFELKMNPWTVKNELDLFVNRYSYKDTVRLPGDDTAYPGGISFTHDMGVANSFSRPGYSAYELHAIEDCFSHMTHEQLVNWVLCAAAYVQHTGDSAWLGRNLGIFEECLESMVNRDHPDPAQRNGIMGLDSARTMGGAEITTYDSLDVSLGQARNNIYLAGKSWAAYVAMEKLFAANGRPEAGKLAGDQAERCARTITGQLLPEGYIPAVIAENNDSRIIPAIEGLVFPLYTGCPEALDPNGRFAAYIGALKQHLATVLVPGVCLFADGGWKLSSTSDNSWLSKIYLSQFIARHILGLPWDEAGAAADAAHVAWLTSKDNAYWSWSDQMLAGVICGSRYYPRGVTAILWLDEARTD